MGRTKCFKRDEVLDKAIQLFWRQGFAETSLHDLEKATGVNKSGLYSEFKDKDDLFVKSLRRYAETNGVIETLTKLPLGRQNIEDFLLAGQRCSGQKGCFIANTVREISILSPQAKSEIQTHMKRVRDAVAKNLEALVAKKDIDGLTDLVITFSSGMALRANTGDIQDAQKRVRLFLDKIVD